MLALRPLSRGSWRPALLSLRGHHQAGHNNQEQGNRGRATCPPGLCPHTVRTGTSMPDKAGSEC